MTTGINGVQQPHETKGNMLDRELTREFKKSHFSYLKQVKMQRKTKTKSRNWITMTSLFKPKKVSTYR